MSGLSLIKNINKFNQILVADAHTEYKPEYENKIRGRVQDQNVQVSVQPMYVLTYYERPDAVRQNIYYVKGTRRVERYPCV